MKVYNFMKAVVCALIFTVALSAQLPPTASPVARLARRVYRGHKEPLVRRGHRQQPALPGQLVWKLRQGPEGPLSPAAPIVLTTEQIALQKWYPAISNLAFSVGSQPRFVAFDGANVYVANYLSGSVTKLSVVDGTTVAFPAVLPGASGVAYDGANLWVTLEGGGNDQVAKVSSTGTILGTYPTGSDPYVIKFDGTNVWICNVAGNSVTKIVASTGVVAGTYGVGLQPYDLAFDGANIWVANSGGNSITKLRASDGTVLATYTGYPNPQGIVFDGTNIWVACYSSNSVYKILASTGGLIGTYPVSSPANLVYDGSHIWVTNYNQGSVTELSDSSGATLGRHLVGTNPDGIVFDGANFWVVNQASNTVNKL